MKAPSPEKKLSITTLASNTRSNHVMMSCSKKTEAPWASFIRSESSIFFGEGSVAAESTCSYVYSSKVKGMWENI
jgi:hypothetical protein